MKKLTILATPTINEKASMSAEDSPHAQRSCLFCNVASEDNEDLGQLLHKGSITVHQNCMYFSSGLSQNGDTDNGLSGFTEEDIRAEVARGVGPYKMCCGCGKRGNYIGCAKSQCKKAGHLPCVIKSKFLLQFFDEFRVYCPAHRPKQSFTPPTDSSAPYSCPICLSDIPSPPCPTLPFNILSTPCCNRLCHRACIQRQARSAGEHYFRCPICNNQDQFNTEMRLMGIEIPSRDASWETCDQFSDIHNPTACCNLPCCRNREGRRRHSEDNKIIDCVWCGQCIGHLNCIRPYLRDSDIVIVTDTGSGEEYICRDCIPVYNRKRSHVEVEDSTPSSLMNFNTPKKRKTSSICCDKKCNVTLCSCIYGRAYYSPCGPYKLIQCSECEVTIGHSECVKMSKDRPITVRGGRRLCKGCDCYSQEDGSEDDPVSGYEWEQGVESNRNVDEEAVKEDDPVSGCEWEQGAESNRNVDEEAVKEDDPVSGCEWEQGAESNRNFDEAVKEDDPVSGGEWEQGVESNRNVDEEAVKEDDPDIIVIDDSSSESSLEINIIESSDDEELISDIDIVDTVGANELNSPSVLDRTIIKPVTTRSSIPARKHENGMSFSHIRGVARNKGTGSTELAQLPTDTSTIIYKDDKMKRHLPVANRELKVKPCPQGYLVRKEESQDRGSGTDTRSSDISYRGSGTNTRSSDISYRGSGTDTRPSDTSYRGSGTDTVSSDTSYRGSGITSKQSRRKTNSLNHEYNGWTSRNPIGLGCLIQGEGSRTDITPSDKGYKQNLSNLKRALSKSRSGFSVDSSSGFKDVRHNTIDNTLKQLDKNKRRDRSYTVKSKKGNGPESECNSTRPHSMYIGPSIKGAHSSTGVAKLNKKQTKYRSEYYLKADEGDVTVKPQKCSNEESTSSFEAGGGGRAWLSSRNTFAQSSPANADFLHSAMTHRPHRPSVDIT